MGKLLSITEVIYVSTRKTMGLQRLGSRRKTLTGIVRGVGGVRIGFETVIVIYISKILTSKFLK